jgi:hypothetical protein
MLQVQVIKLRSSNTIPPSFTFNVSFTHLGVTSVSAPISATNIPSLLDEDALSTGVAPGEIRTDFVCFYFILVQCTGS